MRRRFCPRCMKRRSGTFPATRKSSSCTRKLLVLSRYHRGEKEGDSAMDIKVMTRIYASRFYHSWPCTPDFLYSQSDFYRGKTLRIVHGRDERMEINFVRPISIRHCAPDERAGRKSKSDSRAAARRQDKDLLPALVRAPLLGF